MPLIDLHSLHDELLNKTKSLDFQDITLPKNFQVAYQSYLSEKTPNGYQSITWAKYSSKITTSSGKFIYATNYWFYIASELAEFTKILKEYKSLFLEAYKEESSDQLKIIADSFRKGDKSFETNTTLSALSPEEQKYFHVFMSDYSQWGGGKSIDRNDFYVSSVLKSGNLLAETQSGIAELAHQLASNEELWRHLQGKISIPKVSDEAIQNKIQVDFNINLPKPFLLLAGISGTGKTRFVREQAARVPEENNYCLVSVRPDWHEPSDLLGYISRMSEKPEYVCTDTLRFIVSAWKHLIEEITEDAEETLGWRGKSLNEIAPFWLCLDEMNLAPVEQYFADYLSVLETREWLSAEQLESYNQANSTEHEYSYTCDPLLKSDAITTLPEESQIKMATTLGLDLGATNDQKLWDYFCQSGIAIPFNLIVAGTVNMDETTHGFSRKVIDRALSFDFGEFFPNDFDAFFEPKTQPLTLSYPVWSDGRDLSALQTSFDIDGQQSVAFLKAINTILDGTPFKLAYRALNELLINIISAQPTDEPMLLAVWDDFIMTKLLPRIEGDADKLSVPSQQADDFTTETVLDSLLVVLADQFNAIWAGETRPDLYREYLVEQEDSKIILIECRSKTKLQWMKKRLDSATFTSFWP